MITLTRRKRTMLMTRKRRGKMSDYKHIVQARKSCTVRHKMYLKLCVNKDRLVRLLLG